MAHRTHLRRQALLRRDKEGKFKDVVDVGKSLAADRRSKSKTVVKPGQGTREREALAFEEGGRLDEEGLVEEEHVEET